MRPPLTDAPPPPSSASAPVKVLTFMTMPIDKKSSQPAKQVEILQVGQGPGLPPQLQPPGSACCCLPATACPLACLLLWLWAFQHVTSCQPQHITTRHIVPQHITLCLSASQQVTSLTPDTKQVTTGPTPPNSLHVKKRQQYTLTHPPNHQHMACVVTTDPPPPVVCMEKHHNNTPPPPTHPHWSGCVVTTIPTCPHY